MAATVGEPPEEIDPPLYEVVDPDALERLFQGRDYGADRVNGEVAFTHAGCRVVVDGTGDVTVSPVEETPTSASDTSARTRNR